MDQDTFFPGAAEKLGNLPTTPDDSTWQNPNSNDGNLFHFILLLAMCVTISLDSNPHTIDMDHDAFMSR